MDKRTKGGKLYAATLDQFPDADFSPSQLHLLQAIAFMLTEVKNPKKPKQAPLLYTEHDVLGVLNYDLEVVRHGVLNRKLRTIELRDTDLEQFEVWFREVMYPWLHSKDIALTYSMLCRKYTEWLERARQYNGQSSAVQQEENWR